MRLGEAGATLIGASPKMIAVYRMLKQVAHSPTTTVLIQGESGTGKELIARAIHLASDRRDKRFMDINCAALTESLLEAEIFGYEKGAFTGAANSGKPGLFEVANGGTVFLDEIGEMSLPLQAKLLRVLQEKRFKRVGGIEDVEVDIRIIASTNRDLETLVQEGKFRLDLYYRLRVIPILIPPLRDRQRGHRPDRAALRRVLQRATSSRKSRSLTAEALAALEAYAWPGNVRELRNVIERAVILSAGGDDRPRIAPLRRRAAAGGPADGKRHRQPLHRRNGKAPHPQGPRQHLLAQEPKPRGSWASTAPRCTTRSAITNSRRAPHGLRKEIQMNRKLANHSGSSATAVAAEPRRAGTTEPRKAMATAIAERNLPASLTAAMDALVHGYSAELEIYSTVRQLTRRQGDILCDGGDLDQFGDLLDEKEDLLRMIEQVESAMKGAKTLVLGRKQPECPNRWQLERLLDKLAAMIEEIRAIEGANASLLESALAG